MRLLAALALVGFLAGCASARVDENNRPVVRAWGDSYARYCARVDADGTGHQCYEAKGGTVSPVFGEVLAAPFRILGAIVGIRPSGD